ncbi:MAG: carboxypeptidase regulatory-like domain-containing protein [Dermatophilaceae bacterium]|nr:carboxypeptidase regulatory-like domain-containing protein [Dermatophilaceae bacterium]
MTPNDSHPDLDSGLHPDDLELLDRLARIAAVVDPVPDDVVELGRAAFELHRADSILMTLVADAGAPVRDNGSVTASHILVFTLAEVSIELEVTRRGEFASVIGVVMAGDRPCADECPISLETAASSTPHTLDEGRFAFERVPVGLARLVLERGGEPPMRTLWFDVR